jgi:heme-degrading monooxygenase HmoA
MVEFGFRGRLFVRPKGDQVFNDPGVRPMTFAQNVHFQLKSGKEREFTALFEKEVLSLLRKQTGFREYFTLIRPKHVLGISIWDDQKSAEKFQTTVYPAVLAKLGSVLDGTPKVETYDITSSRHFTAVRSS